MCIKIILSLLFVFVSIFGAEFSTNMKLHSQTYNAYAFLANKIYNENYLTGQ